MRKPKNLFCSFTLQNFSSLYSADRAGSVSVGLLAALFLWLLALINKTMIYKAAKL